MNERGKKWLLWGSLGTMLLSISAMFSRFVSPSDTTDILFLFGFIFFILSFIALTVLVSMKYQDRKWLMLTSKVSAFLYPLFLFALYFISNFDSGQILGLFVFFVSIIFIFIGLINVFIFREAGEIIGILIFLLFIVVSFVLQRIFPDLGNIFFVFLSASTGCGMLMFGIRCLFLVEKNSYLKIISFIASVLIAFGSVVFILKMQISETGIKTEIIELVYFIPAFLITLIVLFSLPVSGYINWSSLHKRILKKIMISWVFFLLVFSVSFVFPDVFQKIAFKENKPQDKFRMMDYELQNKNGLKPE